MKHVVLIFLLVSLLLVVPGVFFCGALVGDIGGKLSIYGMMVHYVSGFVTMFHRLFWGRTAAGREEIEYSHGDQKKTHWVFFLILWKIRIYGFSELETIEVLERIPRGGAETNSYELRKSGERAKWSTRIARKIEDVLNYELAEL